jgi:hypothetical protein
MHPGSIVTIFAVVVNTDLTEGRGRSHDIAYFHGQLEARVFAKGRNTMGTDGCVESREAVLCTDGRLVVGKFVDVFLTAEDEQVSRARAKLRASLTADECRLLGIQR